MRRRHRRRKGWPRRIRCRSGGTGDARRLAGRRRGVRRGTTWVSPVLVVIPIASGRPTRLISILHASSLERLGQLTKKIDERQIGEQTVGRGPRQFHKAPIRVHAPVLPVDSCWLHQRWTIRSADHTEVERAIREPHPRPFYKPRDCDLERSCGRERNRDISRQRLEHRGAADIRQVVEASGSDHDDSSTRIKGRDVRIRSGAVQVVDK